MSDGIQDIVRTKRFELVNDKGQKRAEIGFDGTRLNLVMYAPNGEPRIRIDVDNLGAAHISFCNGPDGGNSTPIAGVNESGHIYTHKLGS